MVFSKYLRKLYFKTTDFTHSIQGKQEKILSFYKVWASFYDFTVKLDPAYLRGLKKMIDSVVRPGDTVLDVGCGTGLGTVCASKIAGKVIGLDISPSMANKLRKKILCKKIENVEILHGSFPESLSGKMEFDSVISSFALVHFTKTQLKNIYNHIFNHLTPKGRLGLFLAQGEVASSFETKNEIAENLRAANFQSIEIEDVSDVYRIVKAEKS